MERLAKGLVRVNYKNKIIEEFPKEVRVFDVAKIFQRDYNYDILAAKMGNEIVELSDRITKNCDIEFFDRSSQLGNDIYGRSALFILILAVKRVFGKDCEIITEYSIDNGVYCTLLSDNVNEKMIKVLENEMRNIVEENLVFTRVSVSRIDAIDYFKKKKQFDKCNVLKYISNTYINLYRLDQIYDYFHGEVCYSTKSIDSFELTYIGGNGFCLSYPTVENPEVTLPYVHHKMLFDKFLDYTNWGKTINVKDSNDLNEYISTGRYDDLVRLAEAHFNSQLVLAAEEIYNRKDKVKIVLVAGPTSSGKTTISKKLVMYLKSRGLHPHQISLDDYFKNKKDTPVLDSGDLDLESLNAVDVNLFNRHLTKLLEGEKVLLPEYNFIKGEREYKKKWLQLGEDDVIVVEGLHCLNDELTLSIDRKEKFKIYVSPLTNLNIDNHNRIHTTDTRKLRRIVRDNKQRGYNAAQTLKQWEQIRKGEEEYIFKYQDDADMVVNSALIYELGVLKTYAEPLLFSVPEDDEMYPEALRLINFLRNILPMPSEGIQKESLLREFIGGSCYFE